ncbi:hypothetical protein WJX81_004232 [Elliptochloris bilobata]|uniref:Succinyl-CoA:3-ketoacid-coenzyme A transferase n=1 Tax=Elliptochloris bilobata TaxID=381761 RepID=A0AAW1RCY4_9CHLO
MERFFVLRTRLRSFLTVPRSRWLASCDFERGIRRLMVEGLAASMTYAVLGYAQSVLSRIGWHTFVDPRNKGACVNGAAAAQPPVVQLLSVGGQEQLFYPAPARPVVALLRGTAADAAGNVSLEREPLLLNQLDQAMAARATGGLVLVQVERLVPGELPTRAVAIPGALVDCVVLAPPEQHPPTLMGPTYWPSLTGESSQLCRELEQPPPQGLRRIIARRAMLAIADDAPGRPAVVCLGIGLPEGVAPAIRDAGALHAPAACAVLATEAGALGGCNAPVGRDAAGGLTLFGAAQGAAAHLPAGSMMDLLQGGASLAILGMLQVNARGDVNVSSMGPMLRIGCGGFIDISQSARRLVFVGTLRSGGSQGTLDASLRARDDGAPKFVRGDVLETTFAASTAEGREVLYVTERAVFRLLPAGGGLELCEVAPGVDVERDVLQLMQFRPRMSSTLRMMDARCFD